MLAVSLPLLRAEFTPVDGTVIPRDESSRTVADRLERDLSEALAGHGGAACSASG